MGAPTPILIQVAWAIDADTTYVTTPQPVASQIPTDPGRASYDTGFPPQTFTAIASGGSGPDGRDLNGILGDITSNLVAFCGGQLWAFNSTWSSANSGYALGAVVAMAAGNGLWINKTSGNTNNPDTTAAASSGWIPLACPGVATVSGLASGTVTLTAVQAAPEYLIFTGALTANTTVVLPPWGRVWHVSNQTTGAYELIFSSTGSGTAIIPNGGGVGMVAVDASGNVTGLTVAGSFNN